MGDDPGRRLQSRLLTILLRALSTTWRYRETIPAECASIVEGTERGVVAFWHGKMLPVWFRFRGRGTGALVSMSRDGGLLAEYLERGLGYGRVIRGSSSRSGGEALRELVDALRERTCLITPDGPRGPARQSKPGVLIAAARAGVPVVLAGWDCRRIKRLGSWDRMEIPYPFARINIRYCIFDWAKPDVDPTGAGMAGTAVTYTADVDMAGVDTLDVDPTIAGTMVTDPAGGVQGLSSREGEGGDELHDEEQHSHRQSPPRAPRPGDASSGGRSGEAPIGDDEPGSRGEPDDRDRQRDGHEPSGSQLPAAADRERRRDDPSGRERPRSREEGSPDTWSVRGDEPSQIRSDVSGRFAVGRGPGAFWIGREIVERFDRALDTLNDAPSPGIDRRGPAESVGSRRP